MNYVQVVAILYWYIILFEFMVNKFLTGLHNFHWIECLKKSVGIVIVKKLNFYKIYFSAHILSYFGFKHFTKNNTFLNKVFNHKYCSMFHVTFYWYLCIFSIGYIFFVKYYDLFEQILLGDKHIC